MTITLPLPDKHLSPNARIHWRKRSALTKTHRTKAQAITLLASCSFDPSFDAYRLTFYWPDKRRRDDDNAASSCKAYRDGIADALGIDDHALRFHGPPQMLVDRTNPRLVVELFLTPPGPERG
jgi:crossover junction endodeoxyribonuclease RusA